MVVCYSSVTLISCEQLVGSILFFFTLCWINVACVRHAMQATDWLQTLLKYIIRSNGLPGNSLSVFRRHQVMLLAWSMARVCSCSVDVFVLYRSIGKTSEHRKYNHGSTPVVCIKANDILNASYV